MDIKEIKDTVSAVARKYNVDSVFLFGSYARKEQTSKSDIDLRVNKGSLRGALKLAAMRNEIESRLQLPVDLVTTGALSDDFLREIENEEILLYGQKQ